MRHTTRAFTRLECAAVVAALGLLGVLALPLFAVTRADSDRTGCFNNLRQLGHAAEVWADHHTGNFPWLTTTTDGGTRPDSGLKTSLAWVEFTSLTNELPGPRVLACPADRTAKVAAHWGNTANGLANTGMRNAAVSYFLSFHGRTELRRSVIAGDRDFNPSSTSPTTCGVGFATNTFRLSSQFGVPIRWTNAVHGFAGHLLLADGSVDFVNSARLENILLGTEVPNDSASIHLIYPR